MRKAEVIIASPPDRDFLVSEIFFDSEQFAEINQEGGELVLEIFPRRDGRPWTIGYLEMIAVLEEAKFRLKGSG